LPIDEGVRTGWTEDPAPKPEKEQRRQQQQESKEKGLKGLKGEWDE
jgi:NADH dehydrogenase [ubiquinone] 1 alpha subcomplex assembly factor 1